MHLVPLVDKYVLLSEWISSYIMARLDIVVDDKIDENQRCSVQNI